MSNNKQSRQQPHDMFHTNTTYKVSHNRIQHDAVIMKRTDYDKPYLACLVGAYDEQHAREVLRRFRADFQISYKKKPSTDEKRKWIEYWNKEK